MYYGMRMFGQYVNNCCGNYVVGNFFMREGIPDARYRTQEHGIIFDNTQTTEQIDEMLAQHMIEMQKDFYPMAVRNYKVLDQTGGSFLLQANLSDNETPEKFHQYFRASKKWKLVNTFTNFKTMNKIEQYQWVFDMDDYDATKSKGAVSTVS